MPKRAKFNLGSYKLLTCDMGYLIPIQIKDVIPGDIFKGISQAFIRMQPMLAPIMHPISVRIHHYFVPYRLIWDDFEEFITKNDTSLFVPRIQFNEVTTGSLADYIGVPPLAKDANKKIEVNALPFRAYNAIWNHYYRDQDLQAELPIDTSTPATFDEITPCDLRSICWQKDYFTLARPWQQKGDDVTIPIYAYTGSGIPKYTIADNVLFFTAKTYPFNASSVYTCDELKQHLGSDPRVLLESMSSAVRVDSRFSFYKFEIGGNTIYFDMDTFKPTEVTGTSAAEVKQISCDSLPKFTSYFKIVTQSNLPTGYMSVNDIRAGIAEQRLRERKARYGSEYRDLLASYGIGYNDSRLQLPEFISGGSSLLRISEVIQTAPSETLGVVGDLKGYGLGLAKSNSYKWRFPEHGIFMSLMSVLPSTMYSNGLERYLLKMSADDFYQREIASLIPTQEIWKQELFATAKQDDIFGYIDRYDEYRYGYSTIAGDFRTTLDYWHMARQFSDVPVLNGDFVRSSPTKRVFAGQQVHELLVMAQNMCRARRILPRKSKTGAL